MISCPVPGAKKTTSAGQRGLATVAALATPGRPAENASRVTSAPPINHVLRGMWVGACPLPDGLWLAKAWGVSIECPLSCVYGISMGILGSGRVPQGV